MRQAARLRLVLVVSILASFVAFLDGTVVNVALPAIVRELGGGLTLQQWVVDAYLITLGALILLAGSLSDLLGRKRILELGLIGFGVASALCALAPNGALLVAMRALQGVAGALLVPSSLALIMTVFPREQEGLAIGRWNAWTSMAMIVGPLLGGFLVDQFSWRLVFWINVLPIIVTLVLLRLLPEPTHHRAGTKIDVLGAVLGAVGLGGCVFALIEETRLGFGSPVIYGPLVVGALALIAFIRHEHRTSEPMLPPRLFLIRNFGVGNIATACIYAGLSVATFLVVVFLQQAAGYSALHAGLSLLPVTIVMFLLSPRFGELAGKYGPRFFMGVGPLVAAAGFVAMLHISVPVHYLTELLPGVVIFGLGLSMTVAPLTAAILGSIASEHAGVASAINNAVARIAGLLAIAGIGIVLNGQIDTAGFRRGALSVAIMLGAGGVISLMGIENSAPRSTKR